MDGAPVIFDRTALRLRQQRALASATPGAAFLLERAADDLGDRLAAVLRNFDVALDLGTLLPNAAEALIATGRVGSVLRAAPLAGALDAGDAGTKAWQGIVADEEALPFAPESLDLAVSLLALQSVNDLPGTLVQ